MNFNANPETAGDDFLKIKPNDKVMGVFAGEPREFYGRFVDGKTIECEQGVLGAKFRFRVNFIMKNEEGEYVSKIWTQGSMVYNILKELNTEFDLSTTVVSIKRAGEGLNTSYTVLPTSRKVEGDLADTISKVILKPLTSQEVPGEESQNHAPMPNSNDEIPF